MRWAAFFLISISAAAAASPADTVGQARGAALQADIPRALSLLRGIDPTALPDKDRQFVTCVRQRFSRASPLPVGNASLADRALAIYRAYWHAALLRPKTRAAEEHRLESDLARLLQAKRGSTIDALEPLLGKRLEAAGWHSLEGRTGLLRELMMWGKQDEKLVPVSLPEGQFQARVFYLNGFKSFGWSHYATCGRAATGGWASDSALFAVVPRYDSLDSEEFRVTFLGHETQHFADKARFKDLEPWELEYRAKLVELASADVTRAKVLGRFVDDQGDDPASPHSFANRKVLSEMVAKLQLNSADDLFTVDLARLQAAARQALLDDSRRRKSAILHGSTGAPAS